MAIDFDTIVTFSNGVRVLNATMHPLSFIDGDKVVTVVPSGALVNADPVEIPAGNRGAATLVNTSFQSTPAGLAELEEIETEAPGVLVIGSMPSATAYSGRVFGMVPAPGFERVAPAQKRMDTTKFSVF